MFLIPQRDQLIVAMKTATLENIGFDLRQVIVAMSPLFV